MTMTKRPGIIRIMEGDKELACVADEGYTLSVKIAKGINAAQWPELSKLIGEAVREVHGIGVTQSSGDKVWRCPGDSKPMAGREVEVKFISGNAYRANEQHVDWNGGNVYSWRYAD